MFVSTIEDMTDIEQEDIARIKSLAVSCEEIAHELQTIYAKYVHIPKEFRTARVTPEMKTRLEAFEEGDKSSLTKTTIESLQIGDKDIRIIAEIARIDARKTFTRKSDGSEGVYQKLFLQDQTGTIVMTLWGEQTDALSNYYEGDTVEVCAREVKRGYKDKGKELVFGKDGSIVLQSRNKGEQHVL